MKILRLLFLIFLLRSIIETSFLQEVEIFDEPYSYIVMGVRDYDYNNYGLADSYQLKHDNGRI